MPAQNKKKGDEKSMLIIPVKPEEGIERALKKFKKKFDRTKKSRTIRDNRYFTKPSIRRRSERIKAAYSQRKRTEDELN